MFSLMSSREKVIELIGLSFMRQCPCQWCDRLKESFERDGYCSIASPSYFIGVSNIAVRFYANPDRSFIAREYHIGCPHISSWPNINIDLPLIMESLSESDLENFLFHLDLFR